MQPSYDCVIVGGGMVGASLACALANQKLTVALAEAIPLQSDSQPSYDDRGLVIAPASQRILDALGIWSTVAKEACPVRTIHVSDRGRFGFTRLRCETMGMAALGHVVVARQLGQALLEQVTVQPNVDFLCPARVDAVAVKVANTEIALTMNGRQHSIDAKLIVVADGGESTVRSQLGVTTTEQDYGQTAIVANVTPNRGHNNTAYERFTATGPLAILPLTGQRCVSVMAVNADAAAGLLAATDEDYLTELNLRFGYRLGQFVKVGRRRSYPLRRVLAKQTMGPRFVIIGNAAHTIHPNAAQGLNLGLRDAAELAERIVHAAQRDEDIGTVAVLDAYAKARAEDQRNVIRLSHGLTQLFYNDLTPLVLARNAAMLALDLLPPLKRELMRRAMGLSGRQPTLVRGMTI